MLGPVDYGIWLAEFLASIGCLVCIVKGGGLFRHFTLVLFLSALTVIGVARYVILLADGFTSHSYFYFYYYSDTVLTVCLFFVLMSFYSQVFSEMGVSKLMRAGAMLILGGTAFISYRMIASSSDRMVTRFAIEISQNLYFVAVVLTYLLWGAMMKLRENRTRLMQLVLGMGVYLSAFAASYAMRNLYPYLALWRYFIALMGIWLPVSWGYTFLKVPEDARMATARVVAPTR